MKNEFASIKLERLFNVESIITMFYMELSKEFRYGGESHDFWEMVYIDKGEMLCTAEDNRFILKSGEMTFHKPNEFHNLSSNGSIAPNVSIITFECKSRAMRGFDGKIFKLSKEERTLLSQLFAEGIASFRLEDDSTPLGQNMIRLEAAPFGGEQCVKNLLEIFLIYLARREDTVTKKMRKSYVIDGVDIPYSVKEIVDILEEGICEKLTVSDIARRLGRSVSSVKQTFSRHFNQGIIRYYNNLKIKEAKRLIREGVMNISEISDYLAFENPQYFSKCFKKSAGRTPSEYRSSILKV